MEDDAVDAEASLAEDLLVLHTTLPGCEFLGLFANRAFAKGEVLCEYTGTILRTTEAMRRPDKSYLMRLGEQCYVDALEHPECLAR